VSRDEVSPHQGTEWPDMNMLMAHQKLLTQSLTVTCQWFDEG